MHFIKTNLKFILFAYCCYAKVSGLQKCVKDFKMNIIKWKLNIVSCNFGLKFCNDAFDFGPNFTLYSAQLPLHICTTTNRNFCKIYYRYCFFKCLVVNIDLLIKLTGISRLQYSWSAPRSVFATVCTVWKMEFRSQLWYPNNITLFCEFLILRLISFHVFYLQMIQCLFKIVKHCVMNTIDFKHFPVDSIIPNLIYTKQKIIFLLRKQFLI
jgi:hypothetical protein